MYKQRVYNEGKISNESTRGTGNECTTHVQQMYHVFPARTEQSRPADLSRTFSHVRTEQSRSADLHRANDRIQ